MLDAPYTPHNLHKCLRASLPNRYHMTRNASAALVSVYLSSRPLPKVKTYGDNADDDAYQSEYKVDTDKYL